MNAPLYNATILRLAATIPHHQRLVDPQASVEKRSPVCGSRIVVDVRLGDGGHLAELGMEVRACALGQASASLMAAHAIGKSHLEILNARDALSAYLVGERSDVGIWPGLEIFSAAKPHMARHPSIKLAFETVAEAMELAAKEIP